MNRFANIGEIPAQHRAQVEAKLRENGTVREHRIYDTPDPRPVSAPEEPAPIVLKRQRAKAAASELELLFAQQITKVGFAVPQREFRFLPNRDFRLDYAWPEQKLAVEVQGMVHRIKERFLADVEKLAMAQIHGWRVLLVAGQDVRSGRAMQWLTTLWEQGK